MISRSNVLIAAIAAASWCVVPAAFSQDDEPMPPASAEDPASASDTYGRPPVEGSEQDESGLADDPAMEDSQTGDPSSGATAAGEPIPEAKIEQFADAYLAVQTIQQKAAAELQTATEPAEADKVKTTAETDMIAAVERSGLQIEEFNQIVETMTADVDVRARVAAALQKRTGG